MSVIDALLRGTPVPPDAAGARRLGHRMAALYFSWRSGIDLDELIAQLARGTALGDNAPLARTAHATGQALLRWGGHPYHSIAHHAEVATSALLLTRLAEPHIPPCDLGLLLCASLGHDLEFDPLHRAKARFAAEQRSAAALACIAAAAGVPAAERRALELLVLATEPLARSGLRALLRNGVPHPDRRLRELAARPNLLALAAVLSDADMLSSSGLNTRWQETQERRLAQEWGRPVSRADRLNFFEVILGPDYLSPGGSLFLPNLRRIRAAVLEPSPEIDATAAIAQSAAANDRPPRSPRRDTTPP